ncbi:unnamed protein product [Vitrella brassicaformis CCMP3155]|uniref:Uncharacterized protein n=1 Tax=Vitrella brassicaformis (strain CCMP3155) TaxID=1169540 RepID=A0A0G4FPU4_VITBC|nr:unnamed protein product [Vitrella brassicaformis CCMP3155]|eukprot:CEM16489.1 unnamed protein product [Vitrella brassicaformis CCMP3155]
MRGVSNRLCESWNENDWWDGGTAKFNKSSAEMSNVREVSAEGPPHTRAKAAAAESGGKGARERKHSEVTATASKIANVNVTSKHPSHASRPNNDLSPKRHAVATKASPRPSLPKPRPSAPSSHHDDGQRMATVLQPVYGGRSGAIPERGIMRKDNVVKNIREKNDRSRGQSALAAPVPAGEDSGSKKTTETHNAETNIGQSALAAPVPAGEDSGSKKTTETHNAETNIVREVSSHTRVKAAALGPCSGPELLEGSMYHCS